MSDMENPNWGSPTSLPALTGSRGTAGARGNRYSLTSAKPVDMDSEGNQKRWASDPDWNTYTSKELGHGPFVPGRKSFVRSGLSVGGIIPQPK